MSNSRDALWESGYDESVEVNQRALIDKVLARYSGEFTVFRELLQNSDDAGAKAAEIRFETKDFLEGQNKEQPSQVDLVHNKKQSLDEKANLVHQWKFQNNGLIFRDEDWNRLKKIAEGNPDEEKIGAFGVGFYSLFSVTEEPFVTSGDQWMGFYWKDKKDQLFARRGKRTETDHDDPWTTFEMPLREPAPIPRAFDFTRFLASSITFMVHLKEVSVYLDDRRISRLTKDPGAPKSISISKGLKRTSPTGIMHVKEVQTTPLSIKAEVIRWVYMAGTEKRLPPKPAAKVSAGGAGGFFSSLFSSFAGAAAPQRSSTPVPTATSIEEVDPTIVTETSVVLSIFTADVGVKLDQKMRSELHRSTKKNPPTNMRLELIYTGKDEYDASKKEDEKQPEATGSVFQGLRADLEGIGSARVFIGHATGQTTGLGGHMAARFIPTVERESIDLVDRTVAVWNKELLYVGGFLARAAYELEMDNVHHLWTGATEATAASGRGGNVKPDAELRSWLLGRSVHALRFFTFHSSTPSTLVSSLLEEAFFSCISSSPFAILSDPHPFPLISTSGVRNALDVRIPDPTFSSFLKELPMLPEEVMTSAKSMVDSLHSRGMIKEITFVDVLQELRSRPLSEAEMIACLKWWIGAHKQGEPDVLARIRTELLHAAVLSTSPSGSSGEKIVPMSSIQTFLNTRGMGAMIPTDGPLPAHLLPVCISRHFDPQALASAFPWRELSLIDWLRHVTDPTSLLIDVDHDINKSAAWAERVFQVLARAWQNLSKAMQEEVVELLDGKTCIPTSAGMKTPKESYFQSAHVFRDLPIVQLPSGAPVKAAIERVLQAVGVRKHVDLQIVFNRMIKTGDWTIPELIKYLVAVQSTLTTLELDRLQKTAAFTKEEIASIGRSETKVTRYVASDLYEPLDVFRELGLPVIDWGTQMKWRGNSEEAKFLFRLGLRRSPPLPEILNLAASTNENVRTAALKYFLDNVTTKYPNYDPADFAELPYIPALRGDEPCMAKPFEVYASPMWALLHFLIVKLSLKNEALTKLKIQEHPPTSRLVSLLEKSPPQNEVVARQWFEAMASRISDFTSSELRTLSQLPFVPTKDVGGVGLRMLPPSQCYFSGDSSAQFHSKLFVFVDFGTQANRLLSACGVKHEPSVDEIARILLDNPRQFYALAEGRDNYLVELRNIAVNRRLLSSGTLTRLKRAATLLGSRRIKKVKPAGKSQQVDVQGDPEEEDWDLEYDLLTPDKVLVADDTNAYHFFGSSVFTAPQEDLLEEFYMELGSNRLSTLVREEHRTGAETKNSRKALETRSLILERLPLFLHEHTHARTRISYSWLNNERNFIVRTFGKLVVIKSLNFGNLRSSQSQDASAVAKREGKGPIELWLAGNDQVDMYEVSTSMCRLLFESPKVNDALLFMTILSTDLRALKRRGYNVDRILRQQQAQRQAQEEANKEKEKAMSLVPQQHAGPAAQPTSSLPAEGLEALSPTLLDAAKRMSRPTSALRHSLDSWKRKFNGVVPEDRDEVPFATNVPTPQVPEHEVTPQQSISQRENTSSPSPALPISRPLTPVRAQSPRPETPQAHVTSRSKIASNIEMAIAACRQERNQQVRGRENMEMVKETQNEGYCDASGAAVDITLVGQMSDIKIFVSRDIPNAQSIMKTKVDSLARFIYVIRPLCEVYELPTSSVHIYYEKASRRIAFNRNASLFLSLSHYEAWHDQAVQNGELSDACISWYFALAHEIAHNLVLPHNSEHEFYFSAISEAYLMRLTNVLSNPPETHS
ncbi:hypothetical protein AcW1_005516 [Taiwanofungus camphoratus]|nr:hypothetical protein AcV5_005838 [Antrodia cinnamomea]KAI0956969.1 hypothetical protein AcW1_005516 [Antrodia cinnamomea]